MHDTDDSPIMTDCVGLPNNLLIEKNTISYQVIHSELET